MIAQDRSVPVLPTTIKDLLVAREKIIAAWKLAAESIQGIYSAFDLITDKDFRFVYEDRNRGENLDFTNSYPCRLDAQVTALDASLWLFAIEKLGVTKAMTKMAGDEFLEKVKAAKTPFCERELLGLFQNVGRMFAENSLKTVQDVYRKLIGITYRSGNWRIESKSDNRQKVEKVFRVGFSDLEIDKGWNSRHLRMSYHSYGASSMFRWNDLLTVCRLIEGKGFTDYSNSFDSYVRAKTDDSYTVDCGYFRVTAYLNGNCKVNWNEDKIHVLEKLNSIGAGREDLPDVMRKRYKAEHFHDGGMPKAETYFAKYDGDPSDVKDFGFYETPDVVARRMVELADYGGPSLTLEPSVGEGAIAQYIPHDFHAVEYQSERFRKFLEIQSGWKRQGLAFHIDFLKWNPEAQYDRVLMNPPFNDRVEAFHLVKAFSHLKPGGILVAIIPEGWFFREDSKSVILREFLARHEYRPSEKLDSSTFYRTRVETRIVVLRKPEAA